MQEKKSSYFFYLPLTGLLLYLLVSGIHYPLSDFAGYYFGSKILLQQDFRSVYDTYTLNTQIASQGYNQLFVSYTPFPPSTATFFSPLLLTGPFTAKIIFNVISAFWFVVTLRRLLRFLKLPDWLSLLTPIIFFTAIRNNIMFGQAYLLLFCLLSEGYLAHAKGKDKLAAGLWSIAILLKIFPVLIFLFLLLQKKYRAAVYLCVSCVLLLALTIVSTGVEAWKFYLIEIFPRVSHGELNNSFAWQFQSAFMLLKNIFIHDPLLNPSTTYQLPILFYLLLVLFKGFIIGTTSSLTIGSNNSFLSFSGWMIASLLISPNGSTYSLVLLLLPWLAVCAEEKNRKRNILAGSTMLFIAINIPLHGFTSLADVLQYPRLYLLISFFLFFSGLRKKIQYLQLTGVFIVIFLFTERSLLNENSDNSSYLLRMHRHGLIFHYEISNKELVYHYWDDYGAHSFRTGCKIENFSTDNVSIKNNQVWYQQQQLTNSPDNKQQPLLINGQYIIYLSDKFKGIGFYTLRKIPVPTAQASVQSLQSHLLK